MSYRDNASIPGRIFVGGLDQDCDEAVLEKTFTMFGEIDQVLLIRNRESGESKGFGFISFRDHTAAEDAIRRMNGVEIMGHCVTVKQATASEDRQRGGGGRGGRGGFGRGRGGGGYDGGRRGGYDDDRRGNSYSDRGGDSRRGGYGDGGGRGGGGYRGGDRDGGRDSYQDRGGRDSYQSRRHDSPPPRNGGGGYSGRDDRGGDRFSSSRDHGITRMYDDSRGRSRSPVASSRYMARDELSPPPRRSNFSPGRRDYSPVRITRRIDYEPSPPPRSRSMRDDGGRRYGGNEPVYRDPSPAPRASRQRNISPEYSYSRGGGRGASPPPMRSRPGASRSPVRRGGGYSDNRGGMSSRDYDSKDSYRSSGGGRNGGGSYDGGRQAGGIY